MGGGRTLAMTLGPGNIHRLVPIDLLLRLEVGALILTE